jgi:branched-chain amino acid transport system ATP-binding protein
MNGAPMLEIRNLTRRFQGLVAVDDVTTYVAARELVGLIGPNGAGKTTLFNLISGFIAPSDGEIFFEGRSLAGMRPHRIARLGIVRTF